MKYTIYYWGSKNKKNPENIANYWYEPFNGTRKEANMHGKLKKQQLIKDQILTGRTKIEICPATGV